MEHLKIENPEQKEEAEYYHPEIAEIEPAMIVLVEQIKSNIENGDYDTIISDDVGGRIPSLILRKIFKYKYPKRKFNTFFVSGGQIINDKIQQELINRFLNKKKKK